MIFWSILRKDFIAIRLEWYYFNSTELFPQKCFSKVFNLRNVLNEGQT